MLTYYISICYKFRSELRPKLNAFSKIAQLVKWVKKKKLIRFNWDEYPQWKTSVNSSK